MWFLFKNSATKHCTSFSKSMPDINPHTLAFGSLYSKEMQASNAYGLTPPPIVSSFIVYPQTYNL